MFSFLLLHSRPFPQWQSLVAPSAQRPVASGRFKPTASPPLTARERVRHCVSLITSARPLVNPAEYLIDIKEAPAGGMSPMWLVSLCARPHIFKDGISWSGQSTHIPGSLRHSLSSPSGILLFFKAVLLRKLTEGLPKSNFLGLNHGRWRGQPLSSLEVETSVRRRGWQKPSGSVPAPAIKNWALPWSISSKPSALQVGHVVEVLLRHERVFFGPTK